MATILISDIVFYKDVFHIMIKMFSKSLFKVYPASCKILLGGVWLTFLFFTGSPGSTRCNRRSGSCRCKGEKNSILNVAGRKIQTACFKKINKN